MQERKEKLVLKYLCKVCVGKKTYLISPHDIAKEISQEELKNEEVKESSSLNRGRASFVHHEEEGSFMHRSFSARHFRLITSCLQRPRYNESYSVPSVLSGLLPVRALHPGL